MAMLAEPRRKQRIINLRAKNNAWSNDSSKFGQRMLEKMGWSSGKGLGANENGITEHVIARYKNDERGLGFEDKNDQWTKHEDDFNALLANLSNANDNTENLHSGISLEDKSKKSKARIHYHKFTRGKDISRYSEKDLANIFGKKSLKNMEETPVPLKEDLKTTEQIFTEKGSMEDYFKNKLAEFKSKGKLKVTMVNEVHQNYDEPSYAFQGFLQNTDSTELSHDTEYNQEKKVSDKYVTCDSENVKRKKKKCKITDDNCSNEKHENSSNSGNQQHNMENYDDTDKKVKRKKLKNKMQVHEYVEEICEIQEITQEKTKKKKSKNKDKFIENNVEELHGENGHISLVKANKAILPLENEKIEDNSTSHDIVKKEKSKRKHELNVEVVQDTSTEHVSKKKKKRKCEEN